jgi:hypothetical protein
MANLQFTFLIALLIDPQEKKVYHYFPLFLLRKGHVQKSLLLGWNKKERINYEGS